MKHIAQELAASIAGKVNTSEPLSRHTSFQIGGPADLFAEPQTAEELAAVLSVLRRERVPYFILGNGTNLLVNDNGYRGAVVRLTGKFAEIAYDGSSVKAGAAVVLARLARDACGRGLYGLEFAAGIPGSVGGALVMNAGAHGRSVGDVLLHAEIFDPTSGLHIYKPEELGLSYRASRISPGAVVCAAAFRLKQGEVNELVQKCREYLQHRCDRQPRQPNAGSVFKNPPGDAAGRLVEAAGLKGRRMGGAMISDVHANFIVNCGGATAKDVLSLVEIAREAVAQQFGTQLELEIRLLGY